FVDSLSILLFFNATAATDIYSLSLHDALPIWDRQLDHLRLERRPVRLHVRGDPERAESWDVIRMDHLDVRDVVPVVAAPVGGDRDRKSTRLNSSHVKISYAVFCLKKKKR